MMKSLKTVRMLSVIHDYFVACSVMLRPITTRVISSMCCKLICHNLIYPDVRTRLIIEANLGITINLNLQ